MRNFRDFTDPSFYRSVPEDWLVVMTDVEGSTQAVARGLYKEVNTAGVLGVMALANYWGHMDFPFVFGGDGATILLPPEEETAARRLLTGTVLAVQSYFSLNLRLGLIPVKKLREAGTDLKIARMQISGRYSQAVLDGSALDLAETWLKDPRAGYQFSPQTETSWEPDFRGYTCRWEDFISPQEETIALIIKPRQPGSLKDQGFFGELDSLLGHQEERHPLSLEKTRFSFKSSFINRELLVTRGKRPGLVSFFQRQAQRVQMAGIRLVILLGLPVSFPVNGGRIQVKELTRENIRSCDFQKYDGTLKLVAALTKTRREKLTAWLEQKRAAGDLWYGLHISDRATLTCLLHAQAGQEVHFVDAAEGGYTLAAQKLKQQIKDHP